MTITEVDGKPCYLSNDYALIMEELKDFTIRVKSMRQFQKQYFNKGRQFVDLQSAKRFESEVDREIQKYESRWNENIQPKLF
jgi:hypothetical protein